MITIDTDDLDMDQILSIKRECLELAQRTTKVESNIPDDILMIAKKYEKFFIGEE